MAAHLVVGEVAPAAPFVGAGVLGILTLGAFLVYIVTYGLHQGWDHTVGYGLRWIADQIENVSIDVGFTTIHPFGFVADVFRSVDHHISHALAVAALNSEKTAASLWHLTAQVFWWSVHETKVLAIDTYHALEHIVGVNVPDAAKWARREAVAVAHRLVRVEAAERRAADLELRHLARVAEADATHALREAGHALDWSESKVGHLERDLGGLRARVDRIAKQLSPAAIVALIGATIFKDFGLGWLRCGNVGRLGRSICGMPVRLLEDVVGLLADYLIVTNLCEVVPLLETAYGEVAAPAVAALTQAIDASPCVQGHQAPALTVPTLHLPAAPSLALSLP